MFRKTFQHVLFLTFFAFTLIKAQIFDSSLVVDSAKILNETDLNEGDIPPVRYENGIKIVGKKTFDIELKDGILTLKDVKIGNGKIADVSSGIEDVLGQMGLSQGTNNSDIKQIVYAANSNWFFLVFESAVIRVRPIIGEGTHISGARTSDFSKIFSHDGAIFVTPGGTLVATTPTTLLIITEKSRTATYDELFGSKIPPLKKPILSAGRTPEEVAIRDETLSVGSATVRLEINTTTNEIEVVEDAKAMNRR